MPEPKREEEKILSIDDGREERQVRSESNAGGDSDPVDTPAGTPSAVNAEIAKLRAEKEDLLQTLVRRQADFENFRKRTERDRSEEARRGVELIDLGCNSGSRRFRSRASRPRRSGLSKSIAKASR